MALDKEAILASDDLPKETVAVPEWGGDVIVRSMTGSERDSFEQAVYGGKTANLKNVRARLCALTMVDDNGERLFPSAESADLDALGKKSAKALDRVFAAAKDLNGLSEKDVDDLAGN